MLGGSGINNDSVFMRWMRVELGKLNRGVVANRKTLSQLLLEERPSSVTKSGDEYLFNEQIIEMLAEKLPGEIHDNLKFPIFSSILLRWMKAATSMINTPCEHFRYWGSWEKVGVCMKERSGLVNQ